MDSKSKCIGWVGNIYQKFEAMCLEVDDMVCQETLQYVEDQLQTAGANVKQFCTELMQEVLPSSPTNSMDELNLSLVQNAEVIANEDLNISIDEDRFQKEQIHASSVESVEDVHFGLSSEQSTEDESAFAHCSGDVSSDCLILARTCKDEPQDIDSTLDDTSLEEASHISVSELDLGAVSVSVPVPSFDKVKLEESCIIVDSSELRSLSNELRERRSFKKSIREAFSSKSRLSKRGNEQHHPGSSKERRNNLELSGETNKSESQEIGFCESDWEII